MAKLSLIAMFGISIFGLSACQTIPYAERVVNFENQIKSEFIGQSVDKLILSYGPTSSTYKLTDGRELAQYKKEESGTRGGDSYMDYQSVYRGSQTITKSDGSTKTVPIYDTVPIWRTNPVYTYHNICIKRFIINKDKIVEDFKWEGNSCFR